MLRVLLLRHGLTDANASGVIQGHRPTPLNEVGRAQARRLAERLARHGPRPDRLVSSDLPRAAQTAEPVAAACGLEVVLDPAWRERSFGELEGRTAAERDIWRAASGETDPPGAEAGEAFASRVRKALEGLPGRFPGARCVAVVTHGGPCRVALRLLVEGVLPGLPGRPRPEMVPIANASILDLALHDGGWEVLGLNDVAHLAGLGETTADAG